MRSRLEALSSPRRATGRAHRSLEDVVDERLVDPRRRPPRPRRRPPRPPRRRRRGGPRVACISRDSAASSSSQGAGAGSGDGAGGGAIRTSGAGGGGGGGGGVGGNGRAAGRWHVERPEAKPLYSSSLRPPSVEPGPMGLAGGGGEGGGRRLRGRDRRPNGPHRRDLGPSRARTRTRRSDSLERRKFGAPESARRPQRRRRRMLRQRALDGVDVVGRVLLELGERLRAERGDLDDFCWKKM